MFITTHLLQLASLLIQFLHLNSQLCLGTSELLFLRGDHFGYTVVHLEGAHPLAQTLASLGGVLDNTGVEVRMVYISANKETTVLGTSAQWHHR